MTTPRRRRPSRLRRAGLQLLVALAVLAALEGGLRLAGHGPPTTDEDPYVGFAGALPLYVDDGSGGLVTAPYKLNHFNLQSFTPRKPEGTTRIVTLGGSTTYGRPYADATSFSGWLRAWLPVAAPDRRWEVINAGGISYASYRVSVVLEELLAYEPDVVILYTGHNEFLEERTYSGLSSTPSWVLTLGTWARRSALFDVLRSWITPSAGSPSGIDIANDTSDGRRETLAGEVRTLLDNSVGPDAYTRDDALRESVLEHYRFNLVRMVRKSQAAGARVLLVAPASQLLDCRPFKSEHGPGVSPTDAQWIDALLSTGPGTVAKLDALQRAVDVDPRYALAWYRLGEALMEVRRAAEARQAFEHARDEDIVPLRALTTMRQVVRDVAREEGADFVDAVALMDSAAQELAARPIPGAELFLDHVHMTVDGYRRVAAALFDSLVSAGIVQPSADWNAARRAAVDARVEASLHTEDHVRALSRLASVLDWAGKSEEAEALTNRALELAGGRDAMSSWQKGNFHLERGELEAAIEAFQLAVAIDPDYVEAHFNLSAALRQAGRGDEALVHARQAARLDPEQPAVLFGLGVLLEEQDRDAEAREAWLATVAADPGHDGAYNALGLAALRAGDQDAAERFFRSAVAARPEVARGHYNLALLLMTHEATRERTDEAVAQLRDVLRLEPGHTAARDRLDRLLAEDG